MIEKYKNEQTGIEIEIDHSYDSKLTSLGENTLKERYLLPGDKSVQSMFGRVATYYADDAQHAQRLYNYMKNFHFMPATPILSNGGTTRGFPISCFVNEVEDSLESILDIFAENGWLSAKGGGIGTYWGNVRSQGEKIRRAGKTSGILPFIKVSDSATLAISQGSLRRGSAAVYVSCEHPEILDFIDIRRPTGGDPERKTLNIHHGVVITDEFMEKVKEDGIWELKSPDTGKTLDTIKARELWIKLLITRLETGEPYLLFIDNVNKKIPEHHKKSNLLVKTSNLCAEITLPTGRDQYNRERTAVCCLGSVNLEKYDEWKDDDIFIDDVVTFLDNVLTDFIERAPEEFMDAKYSAMRERSIGLGVMGFHTYLQAEGVPFEGPIARALNTHMFKNIKTKAEAANTRLAILKGACPDAKDENVLKRLSNILAIAPTASISVIAGEVSPAIEPNVSNMYVKKTLSGSYTIKNKYLEKVLESHGKNNEETWAEIAANDGSVQGLYFLTQDEKEVYKTAYEINQRSLIEMAGDRTEWVCQAQSLNIFLPPTIDKKDLHKIHLLAWELGVKSLYYCRSFSGQRAEKHKEQVSREVTNYDECTSCQ